MVEKKFIMYDRFDQELNVGVNLRMSEINALLTAAVVKELNLLLKINTKLPKNISSL